VGYSLLIEPEPATGTWDVVLLVRLTRAETSGLFLAGDTMVSWPVEGLVHGGDPGLERSGMFVSEMAARPQGLRIRYVERMQAEEAASLVRARLAGSGLEEEQ
jgi:hypothetical protein